MIKKITSLLMSVVLIAASFFILDKRVYAITKDSFYQIIDEQDASATIITTPEELAAIGNDLYGSYALGNDIDMSSYGNWSPIGKLNSKPFKGKFDGQGHSIIGLKVNLSIDSASLNNPSHCAGLFGICDGAVIRNLALDNVNISIKNTSGYEYTTTQINGRTIYAGAIAGYMYNDSIVFNSYATGTVLAKSSGEAEGACAGGLVGYTGSIIVSYSYSLCSVTADAQNQMYSAPANAGGIIGYSTSAGYIDKCYNLGTINSKTLDYGDSVAGGLIGKSDSSGFIVSDSYNRGTVNSTVGNLFSDSAYSGGISGYFNGTINKTYNAGAVVSSGNSALGSEKTYAGGICGTSQNSASIINSASIEPTVSASGSTKKTTRISNGGQKSNNGSNTSYTSGNVQDADLLFSTDLFKEENTYKVSLLWDFKDVWEMVKGKDYPQLQHVLDEGEKFERDFIQQHLEFISSETYIDTLNNKRWASIYWSEEYCGTDNKWYNGLDAFGNFATFEWGELFKEENLFPIILADYINNQGISENITKITEISIPFELDKKYVKAKSFITKYWDTERWGDLSDEDFFYLFHYKDKTSEEWVNSNFPDALEYIVYDTKHEGEWMSDVLGVVDESITAISECKDKFNSVINYINNCIETAAWINTFISTSEEFKTILQRIYDNLEVSLADELSHVFGFDLKEESVTKLRNALGDYVNFISTTNEGMSAELWIRFAVDGITQHVVEEIKNTIISKTTDWLKQKIGSKAVAILQAMGWVASSTAKFIDFMTNEKELQQYRALLQANSIFESAMYKAINSIEFQFINAPTYKNAKLFDAAFKFFKETEIYSMNVLTKYLDAYQTSYYTSITNMSNSTKASEIEEVLINRRALYNTLCHGTKYSLGGKIITVACPTNVHLLDEDNNEVVSIINDEVMCSDEMIDVFVTHGIKYIVVPLEHSYTISIDATDTGKMEYSIAEYDDHTQNVQTAIFTDIPLTNSKSFQGEICGELNASENAYNLTSEGETIEPDFVANKNNEIVSPQQLSISESNVRLSLEETYQISYSISPVNSSIDAVIWTSTNEDVVTVSESGLIIPKSVGTSMVRGFTFVGGVSDEINITVIDPNVFSVTTEVLPDGYAGLIYNSVELEASDRVLLWSLSDGALPTGLTLSDDGVIGGTPTATGVFDFEVTAVNENGEQASKSLTISIPASAKSPTIITTNLNDAYLGTSYNEYIEINSTPKSQITISHGILPDGLSLSKAGIISGIPTKTGTYTFSIRASNGMLPDAEKEYTITVNNKSIASGTTGNLFWVFYENGELVISGNGAPNSYSSGQSPWYQLADRITKVTFEGNITSISSYMFENCSNLENLSIPSTVTQISEYALYKCDSLKELTIPFVGSSANAKNTYDSVLGYIFGRVGNNENGITQYYNSDDSSLYGYSYAVPNNLSTVSVTNASQIPFGAFSNCSTITQIVLNDGIASVDEYAFYSASSLTSLCIPNSVGTIGESSLSGCSSIEELTIPFVGNSRNSSDDYTAVFGFIFGRTNSGGTKQYFKLEDGSLYSYNYSIPSSLKKVTVKDDESIALGAFSNCSSIECLVFDEVTNEINDFVVYQISSINRFEIYNRSCNIIDNYNSFSITGTIYGYKNSTANSFANRKNITFIPFDEVHSHSYTAVETINPTCNDQGYTTYSCECGESYKEYVPALGHALVHHNGKASTCKEHGHKAYDTCSRCDYTTYEKLPLADHTPLTEPVKENEVTATCTKAGSYDNVIKCSVCGEVISSTKVDTEPLGHALVHHDGKTSTCKEYGYKAYDTCSRCDYTTYEKLPLADHTPLTEPVKENEVAATCTKAGSYDNVIRCSVCGEVISSTKVDTEPLGHALVHHDSKASTCKEHGFKAYDTCSRCDFTTYEELPLVEHISSEMAIENETNSTCKIAGGYDEIIRCSVCGDVISKTHLSKPLAEHIPLSVVKENEIASTCSENGHYDNVVRCKNCNEIISSETITTNPLGHSFTNYIYNNDATTEKDGTETAKCDRCNVTDTRTKSGTRITNPTYNAKLKVPSNTEVEYAATVTVKVTATGVPIGYYVALYDGKVLLKKGSNTEASYTFPGEFTSTKNITVKIIDDDENGQKDADGKDLSASFEVKAKSGFFAKLIAFFKRLFRALPKVTVEPK